MKKKTQTILCIVIFVTGLLGFTLQLFVFESPDGIFGFILCLICIECMIGSGIKLCKLSTNVKHFLWDILDFLFSFGNAAPVTIQYMHFP